MPGLYTHPDGATTHLVQAGRYFALDAPVQDNGLTLFRQTLYLCFSVDQRSQRVLLSPDSRLSLCFEPLTVPVSHQDSDWVIAWQEEDDRITVQLAYPAPITKVRSDLYQEVKLFRVDGQAVSPQATVTAATNQTLPQPFVAASFQAALSSPTSSVSQHKVQVEHQAHSSGQPVANRTIATVIPPLTDYQMKYHEAVITIQATLAQLEIRGVPTTPRLRLLTVDQTETLWQWTEPGEQPAPFEFTSAGEDLLKQWQPALARALAQRPPGATRLVLPLQIESDAPCRVRVHEPNLGFQLESSLLAELVSWTFNGASEQTQILPLDKPEGTPLRLELEASLAVKTPVPETAVPALPSGPKQFGVKLEAGETVSVVLETSQPRRLLGIAIAWHPLSQHTAVRVRLLPDSRGQLAASSLVEARAEVDLSEAGWLLLCWPELGLQSGRYWLHLQVDDGVGLWLGEPAAIAQPVWRQTVQASSGAATLPLHLRFHLQEPSRHGPAAPPSLSMALNGVPLALSHVRPGLLLADLAPVSDSLATAAKWQLIVKAAHSLGLTIRAARLRYRLGEPP